MHIQHCDQGPSCMWAIYAINIWALSPSDLLQAATGPGATLKHLLGSPCLATVPRAMWLGPGRYKGLPKPEQACPQLAKNPGPEAGSRDPAKLFEKKQLWMSNSPEARQAGQACLGPRALTH